MKTRRTIVATMLLLAVSLALVACGGGGAADTGTTGGETEGDAARGETLYKQTTIGAASAPGCITCHSLDEGVTLVGPSHAGLANRAQDAVAGQSAKEFLRESIVDPDAVVTEGYTAGVMYQNYENDLTDQQIDDLVAFLLTLE